MTLNNFILSEIKRLIQFQNYWKQGQCDIHEHPNTYPNNLQEGEWKEQFQLFDPRWLDK